MIEITRSLARRLSAVIRNCVRKPYYPHPPTVELNTDAQGLCIRAVQGEVAVEYRQPGAFRRAALVLPLEALSTVEGRDDGAILLEPDEAGQTIARWDDGGVPQVMAFPAPDGRKRRPAPGLRDRFVRNPPELLTALAEAARSAAGEENRYAMHRLLLRGKTGEVVGTDSKRLYIHGGFDFGWDGDVLVGRVAVFGRSELGSPEAVEVGKTDCHVVFGIGPWTIYLGIDEAGRFPPVDAVVPKSSAATTICRFEPHDAAFLLRALPRPPGQADFNRPVTLDLNGRVCVRAKAADQPRATELALSRTAYSGGPARVNLNRDDLARALTLGFAELSVVTPDKPVFWRDDRRTFLVMTLDARTALPPAEDLLRVESAAAAPRLPVFRAVRENHALAIRRTNAPDPILTIGRHRRRSRPLGTTPRSLNAKARSS